MERKHGPYMIKSSECLYKDAFIEMRVDEVLKPNGVEGRYATARMKPGVAVVALDDEGVVHLVKLFRYAVGKECVEVVQGMIDEGETEAEAARRELREELGIEADEWTDIGLVDAITSQAVSTSQIFLARRLTFKEPDKESTERMKPVRVKLEEAVRMVLDGEITQGTSCTLILKTYLRMRDGGAPRRA
jgi:8-oxo-dGTP pyrophosphatase MutT (NUDIX family)